MIFLRSYALLSAEQHQELLDIRNQEEMIQYSQTQTIIPLDAHLAWVKTLKNNEDSLYLAVLKNDRIIGGINANALRSKYPTWGIFFTPTTSPSITSTVALFFLDKLFLDKHTLKVQSIVHTSNDAALKFNERIGFTCKDFESDFCHMSLSKEQWENKKMSKLLRPIITTMNTIITEEKS
jgi:RimJ/RimL family protein N-acetyltransferase